MTGDIRYLTPPAIARMYGVTPETVIGWIRSGELPSLNVADRSRTRPRYRISPEALAAFERSRAVVPPEPKPKRRPRQPKSHDFVEYY